MIQQQSPRGYGVATWAATGFGVGRIPIGPGTFGTLLGIPLYLLLSLLPSAAYAAGVLILFGVGVWICGIAETHLGQPDHPSIVWDEVVGFLITMFLAPSGWRWIVIGFLLFRLFDIWKPFPIRAAEQLRGGFGAMADDALAGVFGFLALQALAYAWAGF